MSKNNPETPVNIQMTPVEFSPTAQDAIGSVGGRLSLSEMRFPLAIPVAIMLLTLVFSTVRDIASFNRRIAEVNVQEAVSEQTLKKLPQLLDLVDSLRVGLQKLSPTDPIAAQIMKEYLPPLPPAKPADQSGDSAPAK